MYPYPDARTAEILRLKAEVAERDHLIASLTELIRCEFGLIVKEENRERKAEPLLR
jgi:hypothetical protein